MQDRASTHSLEAVYEGARLRLDFSQASQATLYINGVERDSAFSTNKVCQLKLGSPVQTGYEHHEFIEANVHYQIDQISASLATGGEVLTEQQISI